MPVYALMIEMISCGKRKTLCMAMTLMSLGTLQGAAASAALVAVVSLVSTLLADDLVPTPAGHIFSTYITTTDWPQDPVPHALLGLSH